MIAVVLLSLRNPDLSFRVRSPCRWASNLPELDAPAWWHLKHKTTMYYDGRTDARSVRTNMQFLLGEKTLERVQGPRADLPRHPGLPEEPRAAEVSVPDRRGAGRPRQGRLREDLRPLPRDLRRRTARIPTRSSRST